MSCVSCVASFVSKAIDRSCWKIVLQICRDIYQKCFAPEDWIVFQEETKRSRVPFVSLSLYYGCMILTWKMPGFISNTQNVVLLSFINKPIVEPMSWHPAPRIEKRINMTKKENYLKFREILQNREVWEVRCVLLVYIV